MTKQDRYHIRKPWVRYIILANRRCRDPKHEKYFYYGGKGICSYLKAHEAEILWKRDKAHLLVKPSLDRIDSSKHYTFDNCRFIEYKDNCMRSNSNGRNNARKTPKH